MHRWHRDFNRTARPPPDVIKDAKNVLVEWFALLLFFALLGCCIKWMGWGVDDWDK
jgi:hypothetical protein